MERKWQGPHAVTHHDQVASDVCNRVRYSLSSSNYNVIPSWISSCLVPNTFRIPRPSLVFIPCDSDVVGYVSIVCRTCLCFFVCQYDEYPHPWAICVPCPSPPTYIDFFFSFSLLSKFLLSHYSSKTIFLHRLLSPPTMTRKAKKKRGRYT